MVYSTGKRKTSIAKVWLSEGKGDMVINEKNLQEYFPVKSLEQKVMLPQSTLEYILKTRQSQELNEDAMIGIASIKGNKIPVSFFEYVNSFSNDLVVNMLAAIGSVGFKVQVLGGGVKGQAEAVMYGIAKCLADLKPELRKILKDLGFLTRDSRIVERKKSGLRGARKKEQYSKR